MVDAWLLVLIAFFIPPLAVYLHEEECSGKVCVSVILFLFLWLPGSNQWAIHCVEWSAVCSRLHSCVVRYLQLKKNSNDALSFLLVRLLSFLLFFRKHECCDCDQSGSLLLSAINAGLVLFCVWWSLLNVISVPRTVSSACNCLELGASTSSVQDRFVDFRLSMHHDISDQQHWLSKNTQT